MIPNKIYQNQLFVFTRMLALCLLFFSSLVNAHTDPENPHIKVLDNFKLDTKKELTAYYDYLDKNKGAIPSAQKKSYLKKGLEKAIEFKFDDKTHDFSEWLYTIYYAKVDASMNLDSAMHYGGIRLLAANNLDSALLIANTYNSIGSALQRKGEMMRALDHYYDAIDYYKKSAEPNKMTSPLSNISYIYYYYGDYENAMKYTKEGLKKCQTLSVKDRAYHTIFKYSALIPLHQELEQADSAKYYLSAGLKEIDNLDSFKTEVRFQKALYNFYQSGILFSLKINDFQKAQILYDKILENPTINSAYGIMLRIDYALKIGEIDEAGYLIETAPDFLKDSTLIDNTTFIGYKALYFEKKKNYKEAFLNYKTYKERGEESDKLEILKYAGYMQSKFDLENKENKINLLAKENEVKKLQLSYFRIGLFALLFSGLIFSLQYRQVLKKNKKLAQQSRIIKNQSKKIKDDLSMKENLFGNISHELRTPLTLISGAANDLLKSKDRYKESHKNIEVISTYSNQLLSMSNQILGLLKSKLEAPKINLFSFRIDDLLSYLKEEFNPKARKQNIQLLFPIQENQDLIILADADKIIVVLKNLIQNALKYSKESGTISINYVIENELLKFKVSDTGQGIPEKHLAYIFDRFYQVSPSSQTKTGGVGLGLAICKENIKILGGTIEVRSQEGEGTEFLIELPIKKEAVTSSYPAYLFPDVFLSKEVVLPTVLKNEYPEDYILIVEDNTDLCAHLKNILQTDYFLSFAHDGNEALEQIKEKIPKVIITDWMMKGMSGDVLVEQLKANQRYAHIPILVLTARNKSEDRFSLLRIGVDSYLTKPFVPENLIAHLNHLAELADNRVKNQEEITFEGYNKSDLLFLKTLEASCIKSISDFDFNLSFLAEELTISVRHLNNKTKQLTGLTPKQYITEVRFQEAKRMLETREYTSVKAISYSVGFKAEKNFSRNFKKRFGKYPKDFLQ